MLHPVYWSFDGFGYSPMSDTRPVTAVMSSFALSADAETYVAAIVDASTGQTVLEVSLESHLVETTVLSAVTCTLELRPDGTLTAFADRSDSPDLTSKSLADLVTDALSVLSVEDDLDDLAKLENILATALAAVRQERQRQARESGR